MRLIIPNLIVKSLPSTLAFFLTFLLVGCSGGGGSDDSTTDTTAPVTTASPIGGVYGSVQHVTLTTNEDATIYYSLDGNEPSVNGVNTISGVSPISEITISEGTTDLKYFAIDSSGNQEIVNSQFYVVDLQAPNVTLSSTTPDPIGILAKASVSWQSDEAGSYTVEIGGNGAIGSGTQVSSGTITSGAPVTTQLQGINLSYSSATQLWIYVTDSVGHTGSLYIDLNLKPMVTIAAGSGSLSDIAITHDGLKSYVVDRGSNSVIVIDTNPSSMSYNTIVKTVTVGAEPINIAITPDDTRAYVTNHSGNTISEITLSTDTVTDTITLGSLTAPNGIAITPDGTRAYFLSYDDKISILDTDSGSGTYNTVIDSISRNLLLSGKNAVTPDGSLSVANWSGIIAHAIDLFDVDPGSLTYNQLVASPVPVVSGSNGGVAISGDSAYAYATSTASTICDICKINLVSRNIEINNNTDVIAMQDSLALTTDNENLITCGLNSTTLSLFNASDLTFIGDVELGMNVRGLMITPDNTRAYIINADTSGDKDIVMVPLQ